LDECDTSVLCVFSSIAADLQSEIWLVLFAFVAFLDGGGTLPLTCFWFRSPWSAPVFLLLLELFEFLLVCFCGGSSDAARLGAFAEGLESSVVWVPSSVDVRITSSPR
jgi:hypothetical protein